MLATPADGVPTGGEWSHEVKWDGIRVLAEVGRGPEAVVRLTSRNENVVTPAWPEVVAGARPRDLLVDGEIIALNDQGRPDFRTLQDRMHVRKASTVARLADQVPATFMVFDLLRLDGRDLTGLALDERRTALIEALDGSPWQVPPAYDDGAMLHEATLAQGLEGIVSKRRTSRYLPGQRTPHWRKLAHRHRGTYMVGGWRPQEGGTQLAALLVGELVDGELRYRGRVGSGIGPRQSRQLTDLVAGLARPASPFDDDVPALDARGTHWLEPRLQVDVDTHGLGYDRLRQPSFQGVRTDLGLP